MTRKEERLFIFNKFGGRCAYCGNHIEYKKFQVDHFWPKRCPENAANNGCQDVEDLSNKMPSCRTCNHYKRADPPEVFRSTMKSLHERINKIYIVRVGAAYGMLDVKPFNGKFYFETLEHKEEQK